MEGERVSVLARAGVYIYIFLRLRMAVSRKATMSSHLTHNPI